MSDRVEYVGNFMVDWKMLYGQAVAETGVVMQQRDELLGDMRDLLGRIGDCRPTPLKTCPTHGADCGFLKELRKKWGVK